LTQQPELAGAGDAGVAAEEPAQERRTRVGRAHYEYVTEGEGTHTDTAAT
jgi:hypothetical protein